MPSFEGSLLTQRHQISSYKSRDSRLSYGENPESLSHLALNRYQVVTDGRTELPQLIRAQPCRYGCRA